MVQSPWRGSPAGSTWLHRRWATEMAKSFCKKKHHVTDTGRTGQWRQKKDDKKAKVNFVHTVDNAAPDTSVASVVSAPRTGAAGPVATLDFVRVNYSCGEAPVCCTKWQKWPKRWPKICSGFHNGRQFRATPAAERRRSAAPTGGKAGGGTQETGSLEYIQYKGGGGQSAPPNGDKAGGGSQKTGLKPSTDHDCFV